MRDARSVVEVLSDIFGNLEDIVQSQIRLAKAEVTDELRGVKSAALSLAITALAGTFTVLFLLLSAMYALSLVMPSWQAALVVAGAMALVTIGAALLRSRSNKPGKKFAPRTAKSVKEDLEWAKQSTK